MIALWTALTVGALGSFHCVGMCGPIALALPISSSDRSARLAGTFAYNTGRILTYAILGGIFGFIGQSLALLGAQQIISVVLGVLMLLAVVLPATLMHRISPNGFISRGIGQVKRGMRHLLSRRSYPTLFLIGLLNGLLPCGLVYLGIAGAIATSDIGLGAAYMALFGLGTLPVMTAMPMLGSLITLQWRNRIRKTIPVVIVAMGLLFIVRGLNLGIPYLSPKASYESITVKCCETD